jgi:hypothetical protein
MKSTILVLAVLAFLPITRAQDTLAESKPGDWPSNQPGTRPRLELRPGELFDDTPCRKLWLKRLETFVQRWSHRRAIVGWETFSELDLVTGATEERAVEFTERAATVIRLADPWKRPVTASQAGIGEWPKLLKSSALDFIEIHPYADGLSEADWTT